MHEICEKLGTTHDIIIGGDFNENIHASDLNTSNRARLFIDFMGENGLTTERNGPTFMNVYGARSVRN